MTEDSFNLTLHLQRFDEAWHERKTDVVDAMLADSQLSVETAIELVMIDLEYRWRSEISASQDDNRSVTQEPPKLEDYVKKCPTLSQIPEFPSDLIAEEFRVRHRWGDEPSVDEYCHRFGDSESLRHSLFGVLSQMPRVELCVRFQDREVLTTNFSRSLSIGRQAVGEPDPYCVIDFGAESKLIVASLNELTVSRQQLTLSFDGKSKIKVTNGSSNVAVQIPEFAVLKAGQSTTVRLPCTIRVAKLQLGLRLLGA